MRACVPAVHTWDVLRDQHQFLAGQHDLQRPHDVEVAGAKLRQHAELTTCHVQLPSGCASGYQLDSDHALRLIVHAQPYLALCTLHVKRQDSSSGSETA